MSLDGRYVNPLIPLGKMQKARALEIPVFILMKQTMSSKLGKPVKDNQSGSLRTVEWKTSRKWVLEYEARPQTSPTGNKVPDFIVKRDGIELLAVEVKNWAMKTYWSFLTANRDIIERFNWLPGKCDRVLLTTHLDAKTDLESLNISNALIANDIHVEKLGSVAGPGGLTGKKLYGNVAPRVSNWLGFVRKSKTKKQATLKSQRRISSYLVKQNRRQ